MPSQNINLFQTKTTLQPFFGSIEEYIRIASIIVLTIVFSGTVMAGIAFLVFGQKKDSMEKEKQQLIQQVKDNVAKESLLVMVRKRLVSVDTIMGTQVSFAPFITTTMKIIQSFPLSSFSMGQKNSVSISVHVATLEEAVAVLSTLMEMEQQKEIGNPVLQSFSMDGNKIQIGLSYTVIL
ncbi:MAG: hypothetical protein UW37_C0021G0008 [Candidatus Gottesmanbacteria bacterium GW2011_GWA2_44_17]|uniref:Fimbrial assembly family protein n=1 Tax=Candidatus Gottesmanbacteria bacterium GW2011_GWA2_44_17 TaxID=1618444 RepID=A0A0G1HJ10_9BACT|nr:MAG: hypothetical protein UW37_C0021G0008 [Candidatus Gottesmanbacteria bacterium GW2011_GWA2_44_17]